MTNYKFPTINKIQYKLFILFVLLVGVLLSFSNLRSVQAATGVMLSGQPSTVNAKIGDTFTVTVVMDPNGGSVAAANLHLSYDPVILEGQSITAGSVLPVVLGPGKIGSGTASIALGASIGAIVNTPGSIATLTFKALKAGNTSVSLNGSQTASADVTGNSAGTLNPTAVVVTGGTVTPPSTAPATNKPVPTPTPFQSPNVVSLSMQPAISNPTVGSNVSLQLNLDPGGDKVTAAELHIKFDPIKLQAVSITQGTLMPTLLTAGSVDNTLGTAAIIVGSSLTAPVSNTGTLATINFKTLTPGLAQVDYDTNTQTASIGKTGNSLSSLSGADLMILSLPTPTPRPTPTPTPRSDKDRTPPKVEITNPTQGALVLRSKPRHDSVVKLQANATDDKGVKRVLFFVNGVFKCSDNQAPFKCDWRVPQSGRRSIYNISVQATDTSGNTATDNIMVRAK